MKYYIDELNLEKVNFTKLKNSLYYESETKNIILSDNGYYTIYNNQYYKNFINTEKASNENCYYKLDKYLDKYTVYVDDNEWIKKKVSSLPINHKNIVVTEEIFKVNEKCNVSFIIEKTEKGEICDAYFLSHLSETDFSFQETMSYLLSKLI